MITNRFLNPFLSPTLILFVISCGLFGLGGCSGLKNVAEEKPIWTIERPINPHYYIGIASAPYFHPDGSKIQFPYNAKETAKENALNSLAQEIRVQINSTSLYSILSVNNLVDRSFAEDIKTTVTEDLEGYNLMGEYGNKDEVFV